jgi:hypothetical protein
MRKNANYPQIAESFLMSCQKRHYLSLFLVLFLIAEDEGFAGALDLFAIAENN